MKPVMRVQISAASDTSKTAWMDAEQVAGRYGLAVAREQLERLVQGKVWIFSVREDMVHVLS